MVMNDRRVLAVDDEDSVRSLIKATLSAEGYIVSTAGSGQEALDTLAQGTVDLVLSDIKMPGMSGMDLLDQLVKRYPGTAVIMLTAVADTQTAVSAMKVGAYDYITKPFDLDDLQIRVKNALDRRRLELHAKHVQELLEEKVGEQTDQLHNQFTELVKNMAREHALLFSLEANQHGKRDSPSLDRLPAELRKPFSSIEEYKEALLRILKVAR